MKQADLSKLYNDALEDFERALAARKSDPAACEQARERLGDVVQANAQWTARVALSAIVEQGAAALRLMDASIEFLLSRINARPRRALAARAQPRRRGAPSRRANAR